jgi:SAM-dependent methyltransferase
MPGGSIQTAGLAQQALLRTVSLSCKGWLVTAVPPQTPRTPDWGLGSYERTARQLLPAAKIVVDRAALADGERVVDVGCGTGNAALLAAARGARVIGVDPSPRLLEVAREQAAAQGLDTTFALGDAGSLPLEDGAADVVLSVFGVIFAPDAPAAASEMTRIAAPAGRIVLSAWIPEGAIHEAVNVAQEAVRSAVGAPAGPAQFAWHDREVLRDLFAPYGFDVTIEEQPLAFTASSPQDFVDTESANHPLAVAGRAILEPLGKAAALRERMLTIYEAANEDASGFRVTSRYIVATARHA